MKFFLKKRPWSEIKHNILERVIFNSMFSLKAGSVFTYIDGLAGAGQYDDGSNGSPLVGFDCIDTLFDTKTDLFINAVFIEYNKANYDNLVGLIESRGVKHKNHVEYVKNGNILKMHHYFGDFNESYDAALSIAGGKKGLIFVDPFGIKDLSDDVIKQISQEKKMSLILNFAISTMRRMVGQASTTKREYKQTKITLKKATGVDYMPDTKEFYKQYSEKLLDRYKGVGHKSLCLSGNVELFHMILCSNDIRTYLDYNNFASDEQKCTDKSILSYIEDKPQNLANIILGLTNNNFGNFKTKAYFESIRNLLKSEQIIRSSTHHCKDPNYNTVGISLENMKKVYLKNGNA